MSNLVEENEEHDFKWGRKINVCTSSNEPSYYRSFTYWGVEYSLYDSVYVYREGAKETDIGKVIKVWQKGQQKRATILWFFRPIDIRSFLRDYEPSWNELFLASGEGKGLCCSIPLEAIVGKCSVICTSKDSRNTLPSKSDMGKAEYLFSHTFDVGNLRIAEKFPDKIAMVRVECLFNREKDKRKANSECITGVTGDAPARETRIILKDSMVNDETSRTSDDFKQHVSENQPLKNGVILKNSVAKDETSRTSEDSKQHISENQPLKKRKIRIKGVSEAYSANLAQPSGEDPKSILDPLPSYSTKSPPNNLSNSYNMHQNYAIAEKEISLPAKRTTANKDTRNWFYNMPWEEKLKNADEGGTLVCLDNLDPSLISSDIQDMISKAFKVDADARIISGGSFSSPSYGGQALVIFNSKDDADFIIRTLREKCLLIGGRPVVASRKRLGELSKSCSFPGHFMIEKLKKWKWNDDKKNTVSTSHCSQTNTLEYNMATQWHILQAKSDIWWKTLHEKQAKELSLCENQLKKHLSSEPPAGSSRESKDVLSCRAPTGDGQYNPCS